MNKEQLKIITDNISDIKLIKLINEQDDYTIQSILRLFSEYNKELYKKNNISYEQINNFLNKVLVSNNIRAKKEVVSALSNEDLISCRSFDEINNLFYIIMNTHKDIDFEIRQYALTNKTILTNTSFRNQYELMNESSINMRNKITLINIAFINCYDFKTSEDKNKLMELIFDINDTECLNYLTTSFDSSFKYDTLTYYNKIVYFINEYQNLKNKKNEPLEEEKTTVQVHQSKELVNNIEKVFSREKKPNEEKMKLTKSIVKNIRDIDIAWDIYHLLINEKFMSKVNSDEVVEMISLLGNCKDRSTEKEISKVFFDTDVLEYRSFPEILSIINEKMNNPLLKNNIISSNILLSRTLLEKRSNEEALTLFEELKKYEKDNNIVLSNLISSHEVLNNISFNDQMKEIEDFKSADTITRGNAIGHFYLNSLVIKNFSEEEKRKFGKRILKSSSDIKASVLSRLLCSASFYKDDNLDMRILLMNRLESEPSDKVSYYTLELISELERYGFTYNKMLDVIDGYTKMGIERIDEVKEKLDTARLISKSKSIDDLKNRFVIR